MRFNLFRRGQIRAARQKSYLAPVVLGLAIWAGSPTTSGYQDLTSLITGRDGGSANWAMAVERSATGSVQKADLAFGTDTTSTASISGAGIKTRGIGEIGFKGKAARPAATPDEARINRSGKRDRLVNISPVAPPKAFNAGSVLDRTSSLFLRPALDSGVKMAFTKPRGLKEELKLAATFFDKRERKAEPGVSVMLASLVNNDRPDILATAYAPAKPDYAKVSPFASLLKGTKEPTAGRFVPPIAANDHAWAASVLPATTFSKQEQNCLAAGVYFEARGEEVKGQAAVAQVILNRVRAPSYPNSVCGVVYQNKSWRNRCQFSFACDGIRDRVASPSHWKLAEEVALAVSAGKIWIPEVGSSTHYHATYVNPRWARTMKRMKKIGQHIFYRTYGGGWS